MRKGIFIFIGVLIVAANIDWIGSCETERTDVELFEHNINHAKMYECKSEDYGFAIGVPSFFSEVPDSLKEDRSRLRFRFNTKWETVVIEGYTIYNEGKSLKEGMDSLAKTLHSTHQKLGNDNFILSGPQYENGNYIEGYSYYSKFVQNYKLWYVYTMVYPDRYKPALKRMFKEIDEWQVWERPGLKLKQGESQTPRHKRK